MVYIVAVVRTLAEVDLISRNFINYRNHFLIRLIAIELIRMYKLISVVKKLIK